MTVTRKNPTRSSVRAAIRAQSPLQHPRFRWWHALALVLSGLLGYLAIQAPASLADLAAHPLGDWRAFVLARGTVAILAIYALVFVRSYHPLVGAGLVATILGMGLRIGLGQVTEEPLTWGYACLLLALSVLPIRVIIRPNADDRLRVQDEQITELRAENARLRGER